MLNLKTDSKSTFLQLSKLKDTIQFSMNHILNLKVDIKSFFTST